MPLSTNCVCSGPSAKTPRSCCGWRAKPFSATCLSHWLHVDTHYKIPEMIEYRDRLAKEYGLYMIYGENSEALKNKQTWPDGNVSRLECCKNLKTEALKHTLSGEWPRYRLNLQTGNYEVDTDRTAYTGVIVGARADEEGSRSKERYFSPGTKTTTGTWTISLRSSGTSSKPILPPAPTCAFTAAGLDGAERVGIH